MFPSITIFGKEITSYAIMVIIGVLTVIFLSIKWAKRFKVEDNNLIILILWAFLETFVLMVLF